MDRVYLPHHPHWGGAAELRRAGLLLSFFDGRLALTLGAILLFGMLARPGLLFCRARAGPLTSSPRESNLRTRMVDYLEQPGRTADVRRRSRALTGLQQAEQALIRPRPSRPVRQRQPCFSSAVAERLDSDPDALAGRSASVAMP